ncbi:hypothetical protein EVAR_43750_1 [Eumeta japonica]|uniref:Uncharacterized protein n=1 Tax=Eumeta variegata TaxID=151549 RepID=A0A4C1Y3U0_EUMVA|nr:hypothetical protein EVAR_43750_1 [Eumeta japonica]
MRHPTSVLSPANVGFICFQYSNLNLNLEAELAKNKKVRSRHSLPCFAQLHTESLLLLWMSSSNAAMQCQYQLVPLSQSASDTLSTRVDAINLIRDLRRAPAGSRSLKSGEARPTRAPTFGRLRLRDRPRKFN